MIINELWNKSPERRQETPKEFTRLQVNDRVVTEGLPGIVRSVGRGGYFVVVENDRGIRSFRADQVQLAEHGGGIGPKAHWQTKMEEELDSETVHTMAQDEIEDDTDLDESERIDERAGPVSVIRWGKPWLDAGRDGERVTSTPGYTIDYTQDNPDFQADAHESELETFFKEFTPLGLDAVYVVEPTEDEQGTPHGTANCDLVNYTTAKPTLKNIMPDDPEAPQLSNVDTDAEMFNGREESSSDPYDLDYPKKSSSTLDLANQIAEAVARINPSLILDHTDSEITEVCYQIADSYWGKRTISESDRGIMAHRAIRILRS